MVTASEAAAHPGHGGLVGFGSGFAHPFGGWDHLLAMIAVGLWAVQLGAPRLVPAAFLGFIALGGLVGHWTGAWSGLDQGLAASVLVLGLLIARTTRLPLPWAAMLVGLFAFLHGLAHGSEMPVTSGGWAYGAGFAGATAVLLAAGVGLGFLAASRSGRWVRSAGWALVASGVALAIC